jgi:hypothetical protein
VTLVVVGSAFDLSGAHRQQRRGVIQRLNLALFVHAEHERTIRRCEVEANDVAHLLDKERIATQPEGSELCGAREKARQMRLTVDWLRPPALPMPRVDQCVAAWGWLSSVRVKTRSTCLSLSLRGVSGRGSSTSRMANGPCIRRATGPICSYRRLQGLQLRNPVKLVYVSDVRLRAYFAAFRWPAQRLLCAAAIRARASGLIVRFFGMALDVPASFLPALPDSFARINFACWRRAIWRCQFRSVWVQ